tara:strand:+ start:21 stop:236 length:216 start_codon:yes stop_codon:yes gene_type:complete
MKLTSEQAIRQAFEERIAGKLQDAELLYTQILQIYPTHPDANLKLGLIAVSAKKIDASLTPFKAAEFSFSD